MIDNQFGTPGVTHGRTPETFHGYPHLRRRAWQVYQRVKRRMEQTE
jgi:hypothetical protein